MDMGLEQIVIEQYQWILGLARKYCRNMMDAEDLAEETVYKILSNKSKYDSSKSFRPWCSVIMLNTYITTYNHESLIRFDFEEKADHIHSYFDADNEMLRNELYGIIEKCRRKSCSVDCAIMYAEGYSYEEIAKKMHIPLGTVRSRISFARNMIRQCVVD